MTETKSVYELPADVSVSPAVPHNRQAEESVISSILIGGTEVFHKVRVELPKGLDEFYIHRNRYIWTSIEELVNAGKPVDILLLCDQLEKNGLLEEIGGPVYLTSALSQNETSLHAADHAALIHENYIRRGLLTAANEIAALAYSGNLTAADAASQATHKLSQSVGLATTKKVISIEESVLSVDAMIAERSNSTELPGIPTPWTDYNKLLGGGWAQGDLSLIVGRPGKGKTTAIMQAALHASRYTVGTSIRRNHVAVFSLEMSHQQLTLRLLSQLTGIDYQMLNAGRVPDDKSADYEAAFDYLRGLDISIDHTQSASPAYIRSRCEIMASAGQLDIVFIDSLNLMKAGGSFKDREYDETNICARELKTIAADFEIPVVSSHQMNREIEKRSDNAKPKMSDLREGGEMDAANIMAIWHEEDDKENIKQSAFCQIKHRNGPTGEVPVIFQSSRNRFVNAAMQRFQ